MGAIVRLKNQRKATTYEVTRTIMKIERTRTLEEEITLRRTVLLQKDGEH